jgi:hypothetical protein
MSGLRNRFELHRTSVTGLLSSHPHRIPWRKIMLRTLPTFVRVAGASFSDFSQLSTSTVVTLLGFGRDYAVPVHSKLSFAPSKLEM